MNLDFKKIKDNKYLSFELLLVLLILMVLFLISFNNKPGGAISTVLENNDNAYLALKVEKEGLFSYKYNPSVIVIGDTEDWAEPALSTNIVTRSYEFKWGQMHDGVDFSGAGKGSDIFSVTGGTVIETKYTNGQTGNYIIIDHNNGYFTSYSHLSEIKVKVGEGVNKGQLIGTMGNTGSSTGTHLHFEVRTGFGDYWNKTTHNPCEFVRC